MHASGMQEPGAEEAGPRYPTGTIDPVVPISSHIASTHCPGASSDIDIGSFFMASSLGCSDLAALLRQKTNRLAPFVEMARSTILQQLADPVKVR